jgi:hypothetical protein
MNPDQMATKPTPLKKLPAPGAQVSDIFRLMANSALLTRAQLASNLGLAFGGEN